jgi:hypothetical protein
MCVQVTKTANQFEISSLLEKILLKQVRWCLTFVRLYIYICVCERSWFFLCRVLSFIFYWFGMVRRKLTIPVVLVIEGWQTTSGLTFPSLYDWCSFFVKVVLNFCQTVYIYRNGKLFKLSILSIPGDVSVLYNTYDLFFSPCNLSFNQ